MVTVRSAVALFATSACLIAGAARAQLDTHSRAPIDITADQSEADNPKCVAIFRGSAEAVQENTRLRADTITIFSHPKGAKKEGEAAACDGADRIEASGHVYYANGDQNARGDRAVYSKDRDQIVMTGNVVVVQGQNVARGDRMTINISTHQATMDSSVTGAGKPGRVRAVFYPDRTNTQVDGSAKP